MIGTCSRQLFLTGNGFFCSSRLDYSGIALLIMGSFVPWLYYSFYCNPQPCFIYLIVICVLGIAAIIVSQWDMFATPQYRGVRAGKSVGRCCPGHSFMGQKPCVSLEEGRALACTALCSFSAFPPVGNCLNLPFGPQGRSRRLKPFLYKQEMGDMVWLSCLGGTPQGPTTGVNPLSV